MWTQCSLLGQGMNVQREEPERPSDESRGSVSHLAPELHRVAGAQDVAFRSLAVLHRTLHDVKQFDARMLEEGKHLIRFGDRDQHRFDLTERTPQAPRS